MPNTLGNVVIPPEFFLTNKGPDFIILKVDPGWGVYILNCSNKDLHCKRSERDDGGDLEGPKPIEIGPKQADFVPQKPTGQFIKVSSVGNEVFSIAYFRVAFRQ